MEEWVANYLAKGVFDSYVTNSINVTQNVAWVVIAGGLAIRICYGFIMMVFNTRMVIDIGQLVKHVVIGLIFSGVLGIYQPAAKGIHWLLMSLRKDLVTQFDYQTAYYSAEREYLLVREIAKKIDGNDQEAKVNANASLEKIKEATASIREKISKNGVIKNKGRHAVMSANAERRSQEAEAKETLGIDGMDFFGANVVLGAVHALTYAIGKFLGMIMAVVAMSGLKVMFILAPLTIAMSTIPMMQGKALSILGNLLGMYGTFLALAVIDGVVGMMSLDWANTTDPMGWIATDLIIISIYISAFKYGAMVLGSDIGSSIMQGTMQTVNTGANVASTAFMKSKAGMDLAKTVAAKFGKKAQATE